MMYGLLLLGLLPLMFLSDVFDGGEDAEAEEDDAAMDEGGTGEFMDVGDMIQRPAIIAETPEQAGVTGEPDAENSLQPSTGDDTPPDEPGDDVDPATVLKPSTGDDAPPEEPGSEIDPATVLEPIDEIGEDMPSNASALEQGLMRDADAVAGLEDLDMFLNDPTDNVLGADADEFALDDDGIEGTGEGSLDAFSGTPLVQTQGDLNVVDGGDGDDAISTGDEAAYAFGGDGDDTIDVGEGAAAVFGGDGADTITGGDGAAAYLDGGAGNDTITGGDADEIIKGGVHVDGSEEPDDDVIDGGGGNDDISGGLGADTLLGGDGDDMIDHKGVMDEDTGAERHAFSWHIDDKVDTLDGGAGNDTLVIDRADTATGGTGNDVFWLYFDEASGAGHAEVTDFEIGEDFLRVQLNPSLTYGDIILDVQPSEDGEDGVVTVNGDIVAVLHGAANATTADVYVEVREDVFR
ncbi:calcium-binding protein [Aliiroseovarius subalbicans]|uniref:calcium-binding protein n=1 Tax=Aliiroseovarius subalbicans TaxID=2925840 RepID=UPI001F5AB105|nr:calcium-binding protein [Aliiroseovarius subalbicans]MCI2399851.1 hypothetical protein [Aliiroseovarius subalbicans]